MTRDPLKNEKKKSEANIQPSLPKTSLVNKEFIIWKKDFALLRIKIDLFVSRSGRESQLCL